MKRHMWVFLAVLGIGTTSWGGVMVATSGGHIGMTSSHMVGGVPLSGMCSRNVGVYIGMSHAMMNRYVVVICGSQKPCGEVPDPCGPSKPKPPSCKPVCQPHWPTWCWPWGGVATSSSSTSIAMASGPGSSATAENSGFATAPGSSSSSYSYAHSVNP